MGLNDSFGHARSQILLMDPPPPINKAFSLIAQEEQQRFVPILPIPPALGLVVNQPPQKTSIQTKFREDRPICTHYGLQGHTIYRCYKLHGYPSGYRPKGAPRTNSSIQPIVSQVTEVAQPVVASSVQSTDQYSASLAQCHSMLNMLQTKLAAIKSDSAASTSYLAGTNTSVPFSATSWIIDSGASTHICFNPGLAIFLLLI